MQTPEPVRNFYGIHADDEALGQSTAVSVSGFLESSVKARNIRKHIEHMFQIAQEEDKANGEIVKIHQILNGTRIQSTNNSVSCRTILNLQEIEAALAEAKGILEAAALSPWLTGVQEALEKEIGIVSAASKVIQVPVIQLKVLVKHSQLPG